MRFHNLILLAFLLLYIILYFDFVQTKPKIVEINCTVAALTTVKYTVGYTCSHNIVNYHVYDVRWDQNSPTNSILINLFRKPCERTNTRTLFLDTFFSFIFLQNFIYSTLLLFIQEAFNNEGRSKIWLSIRFSRMYFMKLIRELS